MKFNLKKYNRNTFGGVLLHMLIASLSVLLLCVLYFYAYLPNITNHSKSIPVPDIKGLTISKAQEVLEKHDLRFQIKDSSYSAQHSPHTVLKQLPQAGNRVKENRAILISINRTGPPSVSVPDILNTSTVNAEAVLKSSELRLGKIQLVSGPFPNLVKEIKIEGYEATTGTKVPKGTVVDLVVMDGKPATH